MSGDCGHGWGYHLNGPSGPCAKCEEQDRARDEPSPSQRLGKRCCAPIAKSHAPANEQSQLTFEDRS